MQEIDLGVCRGRFWPGDERRGAVVLPGARYWPAYPLLWFAREVLRKHDWAVVEVWDEWQGEDPAAWVEARAVAALEHVSRSAQLLVVGKSISTNAAAVAAERNLPAVWLTPLLKSEGVAAALTRRTAPALLVGGSADETWDGEAARSLEGVEVLEIERADHALQVPGDPLASIDALRVTTERIDSFVAGL